MIRLVHQGHENLRLILHGAVDRPVGRSIDFHAAHHALRKWLIRLPVTRIKRQHLRGGRKTLHQHRRQLCKVGGAARSGDRLKGRLAQYGVECVSHLVEERADTVLIEESRRTIAGDWRLREVADKGDGRELSKCVRLWVPGGGHSIVGVVWRIRGRRLCNFLCGDLTRAA